MTSETFYKDIDVFDDPATVAEASHFCAAPPDWFVVVTDIVDSTKAIADGHYKDVNVVGASCIIAVVNALKDIEIPYAFGGDGATLLAPASRIELVKQTLNAVKRMALDQFNLKLRVGAIPIPEIMKLGSDIQVAKYAMSKNFHLAMFGGGGLALAEKLIKKPGSRYLFEETPQVEADFSGLECRWEPLKAERGVIVTAIVEAHGEQANLPAIYVELIEKIRSATENGLNLFVSQGKNLKLNLNPEKLSSEYRVRTFGEKIWERALYILKMGAETLAGKILLRIGPKFLGIDWTQYKKDVMSNSDFWKYSDTLRFVADMSKENLTKLRLVLDEYKNAGKLTYGLHVADSALMTCLVFNRNGNHVHFIDGNNGGYALASQDLKAQASLYQGKTSPSKS